MCKTEDLQRNHWVEVLKQTKVYGVVQNMINGAFQISEEIVKKADGIWTNYWPIWKTRIINLSSHFKINYRCINDVLLNTNKIVQVLK